MGRCYICGRVGHSAKYCWQKGGAKGEQGSKGYGKEQGKGKADGKGGFQGNCYNCGEPGHSAKYCWAKGGGKMASTQEQWMQKEEEVRRNKRAREAA